MQATTYTDAYRECADACEGVIELDGPTTHELAPLDTAEAVEVWRVDHEGDATPFDAWFDEVQSVDRRALTKPDAHVAIRGNS